MLSEFNKDPKPKTLLAMNLLILHERPVLRLFVKQPLSINVKKVCMGKHHIF